MPPWQSCDDSGPGGCGSLVWRGVGPPPYGPDRNHAVGAAISRPNRPPISAAPPPNAIGRHALIPPRSGGIARQPGGSAGSRRGSQINRVPVMVRGAVFGWDQPLRAAISFWYWMTFSLLRLKPKSSSTPATTRAMAGMTIKAVQMALCSSGATLAMSTLSAL